MARIFFSDSLSRQNYFNTIKEVSQLAWDNIAKECKVSIRHLTDLKRGKYSLSQLKADLIREKFGVELPQGIVFKEDNWHISIAAKLGGQRHFELYGPPPATKESRRKGGFNSLKTHKFRHTGFVVAKAIIKAPKNARFAEIVGAFMGDGGMTLRQAQVTLNFKTDKEYAVYLRDLIKSVFKINVGLFERPHRSTIEIVVNSVKLVSFLNRKGLPVGDKLRQGLDIPKWVYKRKVWQRACLRGLLDTDGCTYIDHHKYKGKAYGHIGLAFTSYSSYLLESIAKILKNLGYSPTISTKLRVLLRREKEVLRFFQEFKPSNHRHYGKLREFLEEYRSGCNGAASKAAVVVRLP